MGISSSSQAPSASTSNTSKDIDISVLSKSYSLSETQIEDAYNNFVISHPTGFVSKKKFDKICHRIGIPPENPLAYRLFKIIDRDNDEKIGFSDILYFIDLFTERSNERRLELAFQIYDIDSSGDADKSEVLETVGCIFGIFENQTFLPEDANTPAKVVSRFWTEVDTNGDGVVSLEEWKSALKDEPLFFAGVGLGNSVNK